jgi:hypothetical protein
MFNFLQFISVCFVPLIFYLPTFQAEAKSIRFFCNFSHLPLFQYLSSFCSFVGFVLVTNLISGSDVVRWSVGKKLHQRFAWLLIEHSAAILGENGNFPSKELTKEDGLK